MMDCRMERKPAQRKGEKWFCCAKPGRCKSRIRAADWKWSRRGFQRVRAPAALIREAFGGGPTIAMVGLFEQGSWVVQARDRLVSEANVSGIGVEDYEPGEACKFG